MQPDSSLRGRSNELGELVSLSFIKSSMKIHHQQKNKQKKTLQVFSIVTAGQEPGRHGISKFEIFFLKALRN